MSYSGTGVTYRPDKLPDGGHPGDILILNPNGDPAWLTPGGGGSAVGGLHSVLLAGNSAGDMTIQELTTLSGPYRSSTGHVSHIDFIPSSAVGGKLSMAGGGNTLGDAGGGILFLDGADGTKGGVAALRGGAGGLGSTGGLVSLSGGEIGLGGSAQFGGGDAVDGTQGASIRALGGNVGGPTGQITVSAGNKPASGPTGGSLAFDGATASLGGNVSFRAGHSSPSGGAEGGFIQMVGGDLSGPGGEIGLYSGLAKPGTNANGGNITFEPGPGAGTGRRGLLILPSLPLAVPASPVAGAVWRTPQGFLTMHPHFCVNWPITFKSVDYTFAIDDGGKMFAHSGDVTARTWTIPANASVALAPGTAILLVNHNGAGVITIAIASDVMLLAGVGVKTTIAIAPSGEATLVKIDSTKWIVKGTGLTGLP